MGVDIQMGDIFNNDIIILWMNDEIEVCRPRHNSFDDWLTLNIHKTNFYALLLLFYYHMPPKKEEKKQIVQPFQPTRFWQYKPPEPHALQKTDQFLTTFEKELVDLIDHEKTLEENFEVLCSQIGVAVHPELQHRVKEESKYPGLHNKQYGNRSLRLLNYKIDSVSLKILTFLVAYLPLTSLKISRNDLDLEADDLKKFIEKQASSSLLFLEWNPLESSPLRSHIFLSTVRPTIQHLILRENNLGNQLAKAILKKIKSTPEILIKSLDLTGNNLTTEITEEVCNFIEEEKNIEFFGLSKNSFAGKQFLTRLFSSIGLIKLTEEDFSRHQEAVRERNEAIERNNKKKKGAAEEPVPFVFEVKETEEGNFYVKNISLQNLNLAKNGFTDSTGMMFKNFALNQGSKLQIFLDGNKFSNKCKNLFKVCENLLI